MTLLANVDLLLLGITVAGALMLGITVFVSDPASSTARALLGYAIITIGYGVANYASYRLSDAVLVLWAIRFSLFFASWHALFFFILASNFPLKEQILSLRSRVALTTWTSLVSLWVLSPFVYEQVTALTPAITTQTGPSIALFGVTVLAYIASGMFVLFRKLYYTKEDRDAYIFVCIGVTLTFSLTLVFNFIFPAFFDNAVLIPYSGLFQFPLIGFTAYAILRHHLFNVKVAATSLLVFLLAIVSFIEITLASSVALMAFRMVIFVLVLVIGAMLTRSVYREVEQRELIQKQEQELEGANKKQEALLHFISHEIKGYLSKGQNAFAGIAEGDYGEAPQGIKTLAQAALAEMRTGVETVTGILDAANLKQGTVTYEKRLFDLCDVVQKVVSSLAPTATEKGLQLSFHKPVTGPCIVEGDEEKMRHSVVRNLIDNAVKYTLAGSITVNLIKTGMNIRLEIADTGVGITPEDMAHLFTEGGHGKESIKTNVHSTGFGLYIAKQIVEAHGGKIWAESEGQGKGSRFVLELPAHA